MKIFNLIIDINENFIKIIKINNFKLLDKYKVSRHEDYNTKLDVSEIISKNIYIYMYV